MIAGARHTMRRAREQRIIESPSSANEQRDQDDDWDRDAEKEQQDGTHDFSP
jgi:hypothetical protein